MKLYHIKEPLLEFGRGTHVCPKAGITNYDVYDTKLNARREKILVGAVGTSDILSKLHTWLDKCSRLIPAKPDRNQPNLYPSFCGFNREVGFKASLAMEEEITRKLNNSDIQRIIKINDWNERVNAAVEMYYRQVKFLAQNRVVDVIVCIIPTELFDKLVKEEKKLIEETIEDEQPNDILETNFRRALKAKTMPLDKPLQIVRELSLESNAKTQQDDATKAWNFCTALYYKANRTVPWKLITNINRPSICFVGISFYRSRDRKVLHTSLAQIFDELGNSVILRGTPVDINKEDRRPHLTSEQAYHLLKQAITEYDIALSNSPGRLVIHKSSNYNDAELEGFREAADEMRVRTIDFVTILDTDMRLLRDGEYPPYRGTHIELDKNTHLLYTRGAVEYYKTYTGLYIPQPLEIRIVESDESPGVICQEILSLTKMNWNNTQFDGKYPITVECARKVGQAMKYLSENEKPQISYSFYM
jgi:hypothetical protein